MSEYPETGIVELTFPTMYNYVIEFGPSHVLQKITKEMISHMLLSGFFECIRVYDMSRREVARFGDAEIKQMMLEKFHAALRKSVEGAP